MALPAPVRPAPTQVRRSPAAVRAASPRVARRGAPTGFALYVDVSDEVEATSHDLARTADTLRELVREWVPSARTRAVATSDVGEEPLPTPRSTDELRARLRAVPDAPEIHIDVPGRRLVINGETVRLTAREFDLLARLATADGRVVGRQELLATVWHGSGVGAASRTVDVHVRRIRAAVGHDLVVTVRGTGYCVPRRSNVEVTR